MRNRWKCSRCGDVVESLHRHDFKTCSCGGLCVDGGRDYFRIVTEDGVLHTQVDDDVP